MGIGTDIRAGVVYAESQREIYLFDRNKLKGLRDISGTWVSPPYVFMTRLCVSEWSTVKTSIKLGAATRLQTSWVLPLRIQH